jgi:3-dehydroquinate dehydratase II
MTSVFVMNGPNLMPLGRGPKVTQDAVTLADVDDVCRQEATRLGLDLELGQSDFEGQLIEWIHQADLDYRGGRCVGAVLNPGSLAHTSIALLDAIEASGMPVIEVHMHNPHQRDEFRRASYVSQAATGTIIGLGADVYRLGIQALDQIARDSMDVYRREVGG